MKSTWIPFALSSLALTGCFSDETKQAEAVAEPIKVTAADKIFFGGDILTMAGDTPEYAERRKQASRFVPCYCDEDFLTRIYVYSHNL